MHNKLYISVVLLLLITIGLELINIHLSGLLASNSTMVKQLQISIADLDEENQILKTKVLSQTSFEAIASKAAQLGFVEDNRYLTLRKVGLSYSR